MPDVVGARVVGHRAPDRLRLAEDWLATQRRLWEGRLDRMDAYLLSLKNKKETFE